MKRICPHVTCWNCGMKGHEQWVCNRPRVYQAYGSGGLEGHAQALLVDNVYIPREDGRALAQQMQESKKEMMGKLEEIGRQVTQQRSSSPAASKGVSEERREENPARRAIPDRQQRPGWEGLLEGMVSEIRKEIDKTNENYNINPLYPSGRRGDSGRN